MLMESFRLGNYLHCTRRVSIGRYYLLNILLHAGLVVLISQLMTLLLLVSW